MVFPCYLAMTAAESAETGSFPEHPAWMACHFSPYGTGLSNRPGRLPKGAMLIVNDRTPVSGHDPALIASQLDGLVRELEIESVLLDFQRPDEPRTAAIARAVVEALPCPVGVSPLYAEELACPVFLPPPPLHRRLESYLTPWQGRELWLEAALDAEEIVLTSTGSRYMPLTSLPEAGGSHEDSALCCHYRVRLTDTEARFTLFRTAGDLNALYLRAERLGVEKAVGLFQELNGRFPILENS